MPKAKCEVSSVSGYLIGVSGLLFWVWGFGFRVSGFGFRVSGFGFRVSGFGFRVSGFGSPGLPSVARLAVASPTKDELNLVLGFTFGFRGSEFGVQELHEARGLCT